MICLLLAVAMGCNDPALASAPKDTAPLSPLDGGKTQPAPKSSATGAEKTFNGRDVAWHCGIGPVQQAVSLPVYDVDVAAPSDMDALNITFRARPELAASGDGVRTGLFRLADVAIVPGQEGAVLAYLQRHYRDIVGVVPLSAQPKARRNKAEADRDAIGRDPRQPAYFVMRDGRWLQWHLVAGGMAMVAPGMEADKPVGFDVNVSAENGPEGAAMLSAWVPQAQEEQETLSRRAVITALVMAEENARNARRGMWNGDGQSDDRHDRHDRAGKAVPSYFTARLTGNEPDGKAPLAVKGIGSFAVVEGVLRSVEIQKYRAYLNFGEDWRKDFTIALDRDQMAAIAASGFGLAGWVGRRVLVRGIIENRGGPYIAPLNLASLCVVK